MLKINSNYQDYYDSAIGSFADSEVVINRKDHTMHKQEVQGIIPKEFANSQWQDWDYTWNFHKDHTYSSEDIQAVGFCGHWYYFIWDEGKIRYVSFDEIVANKRNDTYWSYITKRHENVKLTDLNKIPFFQSEIFEKFGPVLFFSNLRFHHLDMSAIRYEKIHLDLTIFPQLKALNFQTQKDPFSALWELEHWFDTHARPDDAVVPVGDDLTRLKSAGFDEKTSFRKPKEKKK